jgi:hypothetical protein
MFGSVQDAEGRVAAVYAWCGLKREKREMPAQMRIHFWTARNLPRAFDWRAKYFLGKICKSQSLLQPPNQTGEAFPVATDDEARGAGLSRRDTCQQR